MNGNTTPPELHLHLCQVLEEEFENLHGPLDETGAAAAVPVVKQDWGFYDGHLSDPSAFVKVLEHARDAWCKARREQEAARPAKPTTAQQKGENGQPDAAPDGEDKEEKLRPSNDELSAEEDLCTFLAFRYLPDDGCPPDGGAGPEAAADPPDYVALLNKILRDVNKEGEQDDPALSVYTRRRFEHLGLRDETRGMMDIGWPEGGAQTFDGARWAKDEDDFDRFARTDLARFRRLLLEDAFPDAIRRAYDLRLDRVIQKTHALKRPRAALCFSGGGIRSGTFALGVIQSLARRGLLDKFDYLSTVSGGGYIGGWLTAWIHRHRDGLTGVVNDLTGKGRASRIEPEPQALRHLREFGSFVTPRTGLLSADSWTFIVIYIRNLLLNWIVLIPLLASVLMIPRVVNAVMLAEPAWRVLAGLAAAGAVTVFLLKPKWKTFWWMFGLGAGLVLILFWVSRSGLSGDPSDRTRRAHYIMGVLLAAGALLSAYALAYMRLNRPSNKGVLRPGSTWDKHRDQTSFLRWCLLPLAVAALLLTIFWAWFRQAAGVSNKLGPGQVAFLGWEMSEFWGFMVYGAALAVLGVLFYGLLAAFSWLWPPSETWRRARTWAKRPTDGGGGYVRGALRMAGSIFKDGWRELFVTLLASLLGALLLYVAAVKVTAFYDPVVEAFRNPPGTLPDVLRPHPEWRRTEVYTYLAIPVYLFIYFLGLALFVGFTSRRSEKPPRARRGQAREGLLSRAWNWVLKNTHVEDEDREWLARASAWIFIVAGAWLLLGGLVMFGPVLYFDFGNWLVAAGGASGLASLLGGGSSRTPGGQKQEGKQSFLQTLGVNLLVLASFVFFCCIVIAVSILTATVIAWLAQFFTPLVGWLLGMPQRNWAAFSERYPFQSRANVFRVLHFPSWLYLLALALGLQFLGQLFAALINLNKFSLHAGYRDRIIRAFLGASRMPNERQANPFTGFDPRDNLYMEELRPGLLSESDFRPARGTNPGGLAQFVKYLHSPDTAPRPEAARYLAKRIEDMGGESLRYFSDPPESVETNPSFSSALFGDLNRILQDKADPLYGPARAEGDGAGGGEPEVDEESPFGPLTDLGLKVMPDPEEYRRRGDYHVLLSRLLLQRAFPACFQPSKYPQPPYRLLHVVNMALNLVGGKRLAWQQRRAESFTATALHSGSLFVGYRRTRDYGGQNGISLGTAVAVSGAAASSNMGYFSPSPFVTFVLTFFNARLGWWLGNPGVRGWETFYRSHPQKALSPIIDEAFGLTDDDNPYVLLSDGGHFENLGLYEMVLRRCRHIVVVDGSADPSGSYDDLGGAVRKIRIDLGVRIEFNGPFPILSRPESEEKGTGGYYAVGNIHYEDVDGGPVYSDLATRLQLSDQRGRILYIKPAVYGTEPRDIFNYAKGDPTFPHESTADQFFDEPQFESHRMLGFYILESLYAKAFPNDSGGVAASLEDFVERL